MLKIIQFLYSSSESTSSDSKENPLNWWKKNASIYPILSKFSKKYLACQGSAAASERVWKTAKFNLTNIRNSISPETLSRLIYLNTNGELIPSESLQQEDFQDISSEEGDEVDEVESEEVDSEDEYTEIE